MADYDDTPTEERKETVVVTEGKHSSPVGWVVALLILVLLLLWIF